MREIIRILKTIASWSKLYLLVQFFSAIFKAGGVIVVILLPRFIYDLLVNGDNTIWHLTAILILLKFAINASHLLITNYLEKRELEFNDYFKELLAKQSMNVSYEHLEDSKTLDNFRMADWGMRSFGSVSVMFSYIFDIVSSAIVLITVFTFFSILNAYILMIILACIAFNFFLQSRESKVTVKDYGTGYNRFERLFGIYMSIMYDFKYGKDIRLYEGEKVFSSHYKNYLKDSSAFYMKMRNRFIVFRSFSGVVTVSLMAVSYGYTVYMAAANVISIGEFMMYAAALLTLTSNLTGLSNSIVNLKTASSYLRLYFSFLDLDTEKEKGRKEIICDTSPIIEFRDVSFKYPNTDIYILKNINIKIDAKEKIAVVGANGAGKTTFVKLLLGFFKPTSGEIFVNGMPLKEFKIESYHNMFSAVFQDYKLLAASIRDNMLLGRNYSDDDLRSVFEKTGLEELHEKLDIFLYKYDGEEGIELSGGMSQRLAISRAVLLSSPVVILDEPTSASDPIIENQIYEQFDKMTKNTTAIFVSHRLAGCAFCDNIVVFDKGEIAEKGSHNELLANSASIYKAMFEQQTEFFKK